MYKKIAIIFISAIMASFAFAQDKINLNFSGEIYEETCDLTRSAVEKKCVALENQFLSLHKNVMDKGSSVEEVKAYVQHSPKVNSTFYVASLKSVNENQALNIEIDYK